MAKTQKKFIDTNGVKEIFSTFLNILNITTDTVQESLDLKADIDSPELTGVPTAPTATAGTNSDQVATTAFVHAATQNIAVPPLATESQNGLMSASDKQLLDSFNPNISVSLTGLYSPELQIINAKRSNIISLEIVEDPHISAQIRTNNLIDVNNSTSGYYIGSNGSLSTNTNDCVGDFIQVTPGDDIYYTGVVGPTDSSSINRRLHVYDANQNWIKQLNFAGSLKVGDAWSTHGVIPSNGAYVRVSWGTEDTNIMISVGAPTKYMPYYITPFAPITSSSFTISTNAEHTDAISYTITLPLEAGEVYGFEYNPILGKIYNNIVHIDSYNGETLPDTHWWSDRDTFEEGTTPSIGAEVIYIIPDQESAVEYDIEPMTIPLFYRTNYITPSHGIVDAITYYAETLSVNHLSIQSGITFGNTDFTEEDIASWKHAGELIDTKAPIDSPTFTGGPTAPNPGGSSNSTRIATTKFVQDRLNNTLAPVETNTNSASKNYAVGDYLIYNGQLYKVTAPVSAGESLIIGTNIQATTLAAELKAIWAQVNA